MVKMNKGNSCYFFVLGAEKYGFWWFYKTKWKKFVYVWKDQVGKKGWLN